MHRLPAVILTLVLLCLLACRPAPETTDPEGSDAYLAAQLDSLRRAYARGDLFAALDRGRTLRAYTDSLPPDSAPAARAELYQHLAQMHFHGGLFLDSINYYVRRAQAVIPPTASPSHWARQYLCEGYGIYYAFNWLDMAILGRLGQKTFRPRTAADSVLLAELQIMEGRAGKQYGRGLRDPAGKEAWMQHAERALRQAKPYVPDASLAWRAYQQEQLVFHLLNDPNREAEVTAIITEVTGAPLNEQPYFALPDRLYGSYYDRINVPDSVYLHYGHIATRADFFSGRINAEAFYHLDQTSLANQDFARSIQNNRRYAAIRRCCPQQIDLTSPKAILECDRLTNCVFFLAREGEIYRNWALYSDDPLHAALALSYSENALKGFQASFADYDEHAVLSKNITVGSRLLTTALQTALPQDSATVSRRRKNLLFRSMELGRALLLTRDLTVLGTPDAADTHAGERAEVLRRELLRKAFSERIDLSPAELREYRELRNRQNAYTEAYLASPEATATIKNAAEAGADLSEVQQSLTAQEALLEFTTSEGRLLALYADRDTTVAYALPLEEVLPCKEELLTLLQGTARTPTAEYVALARTLYAQLIGPVADLAARRERWIVSPATALNDLPLAPLLTSASLAGADWRDLPYLLRSHEIRYVPSYRADRLLEAQRRPLHLRGTTAGIWTHPKLEHYLGPLAGELLSRLPGQHFLAANNRDTYLDHAAAYDLLHLSVHAGGDPLQLHENYLHLTDRQRLNGLTVARQRLGARLVVLAACSTARGFAGASEGTYSLRRSFHQAGVPDVVASVYDIPAAATATLLEAFYRHLFDGASPAAALTRAQREISQGRRAWPGGWAGVIVG